MSGYESEHVDQVALAQIHVMTVAAFKNVFFNFA